MEEKLHDAQALALRQATTLGHDLHPWSVSYVAHTLCRRCGRMITAQTWDSGEVRVSGPGVEEICAPTSDPR